MSDTVSYSEILQVLTDLLDSKSSGTLFIHSNSNHAITFALNTGRINAIFYGARRGHKAISLISNISGGTYKFETSELSGISHELPPTPEILNQLRTPHSFEETRPSGGRVKESNSDISEEKKSLLCQQIKSLLTEYLGPIAEMVFEDAKDEIGDFCSSPELAQGLIDKLSIDIDDAGEIAQFREKAYAAVNNMLKI